MRIITIYKFIFSLCFILGLISSAQAEPKLLAKPIQEGRLAFTYIDGAQRDIYVIDFFTGIVAPLVKSPSIDEYPSWSVDGTKLLFYSDINKDREIYLVDWDGNNLTRLTNSKGADEDPDWSHDGKQIVFHSERLGKGSNLFIMDADGKNPKALTNNSDINSVPRWSPRGDEILYTTNGKWPGWDIMLFDIKLNETKGLTRSVISYCRGNWNKDGSAFVYSYGSGPDIDLYLQKKGSSVSTQLTSRKGREYDAIWIQNDQWIFYTGELNRGEQDYQIFALNMNDKKVTQITSGTGSIRYLSYTPFPTVNQIEVN